jgi:hypothetical protein
MHANRDVLYVLTLLTCGASCLWGGDRSDALRFLEYRDRSVNSYSINLRRFAFNITADSYSRFREDIMRTREAGADRADALQLMNEFLQRWTPQTAPVEYTRLQRGDLYREEIRGEGGKYVDVLNYDGSVYRHYYKDNGQLDLIASTDSPGSVSLEDLGLTTKKFRRWEAVKLEEKDGGSRYSFSTGSAVAVMEYDAKLLPKQLRISGDDDPVEEILYLFPNEKLAYGFPSVAVRVNFNKNKNECWVRVHLIDDLKINCPVTDKDLAIGDMPPWTLVVDRRHDPPIQRQLMDYPREILADEVMLGDLGPDVKTGAGSVPVDDSAKPDMEPPAGASDDVKPKAESAREDSRGSAVRPVASTPSLGIIAGVIAVAVVIACGALFAVGKLRILRRSR